MWLGFILLWFSWLILQHSTFFTTYFCTTKIQYIYNEILLSNKKNERFPFTAPSAGKTFYFTFQRGITRSTVRLSNQPEASEIINNEIRNYIQNVLHKKDNSPNLYSATGNAYNHQWTFLGLGRDVKSFQQLEIRPLLTGPWKSSLSDIGRTPPRVLCALFMLHHCSGCKVVNGGAPSSRPDPEKQEQRPWRVSGHMCSRCKTSSTQRPRLDSSTQGQCLYHCRCASADCVCHSVLWSSSQPTPLKKNPRFREGTYPGKHWWCRIALLQRLTRHGRTWWWLRYSYCRASFW